MKREPLSLIVHAGGSSAGLVRTKRGDVMTIQIDNQEPNVFPLVEGIDVRDAGKSPIAVDLRGCSGAR